VDYYRDLKRNEKMKNKISRYVLLITTLLVALPAVLGFGITTPYWDTNPLVMRPGETQEVTLVLQNMIGGEDLTFKASIKEGTEFATLIDENNQYIVPFGSDNVPVKLRISIPKETAPLKTMIRITFSQVQQAKEGQMIEMSGAITSQIPLEIVSSTPSKNEESGAVSEEISDTASSSSLSVILVGVGVAVLAIIIIIIVVLHFRNKREEI